MKLLKNSINICLLLITSVLASGPIGTALVRLLAPQPDWQGAGVFINNFSHVQLLPYFFGYGLIIGSILLFSAIYQLAKDEDKGPMLPSLIFVSIYAAIVSLNYLVQTTFIPALVARSADGASILISALSMANPNSLAWAIQMYGYMFLGLSFLWLYPYFKKGRFSKQIFVLLVVNAAMGVFGAFISSYQLDWVISLPGMISFIAWNIVFAALIIFIMFDLQDKNVRVRPEKIVARRKKAKI